MRQGPGEEGDAVYASASADGSVRLWSGYRWVCLRIISCGLNPSSLPFLSVALSSRCALIAYPMTCVLECLSSGRVLMCAFRVYSAMTMFTSWMICPVLWALWLTRPCECSLSSIQKITLDSVDSGHQQTQYAYCALEAFPLNRGLEPASIVNAVANH
jgi:hypothetical protein